jgi:hypothetical protein
MTLIPELDDLDDAEANALLDLLEATDDKVTMGMFRALENLSPDMAAAQLASIIGFLDSAHDFPTERFLTMLRMVRTGTKASFRLGMRGSGTASA